MPPVADPGRRDEKLCGRVKGASGQIIELAAGFRAIMVDQNFKIIAGLRRKTGHLSPEKVTRNRRFVVSNDYGEQRIVATERLTEDWLRVWL